MRRGKKKFGLSALTPQFQKKRSDHRSKRMRGDDGGNYTLDHYSLRDDGGRANSLSGEKLKRGLLQQLHQDLVYFFFA